MLRCAFIPDFNIRPSWSLQGTWSRLYWNMNKFEQHYRKRVMLRDLQRRFFFHSRLCLNYIFTNIHQVITLGKKGGRSAETSAKAFLLNATLVPKLFGPLASRYSERQGGYTRIHKYGNRQGDNAPQAILELVDNPRDIRLEMTSRAIGRELLKENLKREQPISLINKGAQGVEDMIKSERESVNPKKIGFLRPMTRWNLQKVLRFRSADALSSVATKAGEYMVSA